MGVVADQIKPAFCTMLGDNFYGSGIHASDGVNGTKRFDKTFEKVYDAPSLQNISFYAIAGNHDHGGDVGAQIRYTHDSSPTNTHRWQYPDWYYAVDKTFSVDGQQRTLEILFFDSVIGCGNSDVTLEDGTTKSLKGDEMPGPLEVEGAPTAQEQYEWLERKMNASTADFLIVAAHYPVYSIGSHGPTKQLIDNVKPLLEKYGAHYMNGHDHDSEHIREDGSAVNYITAGAGMSCCYGDSSLSRVPKGSVRFAMVGSGGAAFQPMPKGLTPLSGFTSFRFGAESFAVHFHAHDGTELYVTPDIPRRNSTMTKAEGHGGESN